MPNLLKEKEPNNSPTVVNHISNLHMSGTEHEIKHAQNCSIKIIVFCLQCACSRTISGLMITASHQTFSGQIKHMFGQIKFGWTNFTYIINRKIIEFAKDNECPDNFQSLLLALKIFKCDWVLKNQPNYHTRSIPFYWRS